MTNDAGVDITSACHSNHIITSSASSANWPLANSGIGRLLLDFIQPWTWMQEVFFLQTLDKPAKVINHLEM